MMQKRFTSGLVAALMLAAAGCERPDPEAPDFVPKGPP